MSLDIQVITPEEIKQRLASGERLNMIDVREDEEVAFGMIPGAKHIPLGELPDRLDEIERSDEIIMICRSGNRSGKACQYLQAAAGINGLKNMVGGMLEWDGPTT
ncbi:MAG: sulfurtransferase [Paenibacillus sp.]|jgi:rhodanese-related sulfurtransferase|nr:sulfurtransferase [Paenibacillus sp.]